MEDELVYYSMLFEIYKDLFTKKQRDTFLKYIDDDYTLSEIAESESISRQAVSDNISKCKLKLDNLEKNLKIFSNREKTQKYVNLISNKLNEITLSKICKSEELKQQTEDIQNLLNKLKDI